MTQILEPCLKGFVLCMKEKKNLMNQMTEISGFVTAALPSLRL